MRYPDFLKPGGTIGFLAPSFGCSIEPYESAFKNALTWFQAQGYRTKLGPNCFAGEGIGISNTPELCGKELNESYGDPESDVLISCGGGELMCEVVPYMDWELIRSSRPKWYLGYSDNTNFTFLSAILADTAAVYGPCAPSFGMEPPSESILDALGVLCGHTKLHSYPKWEKEGLKDEEHPLLPYNLTEDYQQRVFVPVSDTKADGLSGSQANGLSGTEAEIYPMRETTEPLTLEGRLIGGCVDCLVNLTGTRFDKTVDFLERYREDGFLWFLECCDLNPMSMRRAFFQMKHAGWFRYVKGFLIGRPYHYDEEMMGLDRFNAVLDVIREFRVPVLMDLDIGHLPPQIPLICGSCAKVTAGSNTLTVEHIMK